MVINQLIKQSNYNNHNIQVHHVSYKAVAHRYVMSQSSQKPDVIWLHPMNFVIVGNVWVCHTPIACFGDDIICKWDIYVSIRERCSWNM